MNIFVTEAKVAQALARDAGWQAAHLDNFGLDALGCVVAGGTGVDGVVANVVDCAALNAYFGMIAGSWRVIPIPTGDVRVYVSDAQSAEFSETARLVETRVAQDLAEILAQPTAANQPLVRAGLVMRARSAVRAMQHAAPIGVRAGYSATDVEVLDRHLPYSKYFDVEDVTLRHTRFDGEIAGPIKRAVFRSADAVTVLPYDPVLDLVVLVEQFRSGAFVRGDSHPWVLEPVAGRCDGDEPVEAVAAREMEEEAGLTLLSLHSIGNYYPSPGCLSEYLYSFLGVVDLSTAQTGVHGLQSENEDIRTHFLSFEAAMTLIKTGEADNGPLLLSLYWLAAHRTQLREQASAA